MPVAAKFAKILRPGWRARPRTPVHHKLYNTAWNRASKNFLAYNPWCVTCHAPAQHTDHIQPHRGDEELFWDQGNWQPLCRSCHARKSAGERQ